MPHHLPLLCVDRHHRKTRSVGFLPTLFPAGGLWSSGRPSPATPIPGLSASRRSTSRLARAAQTLGPPATPETGHARYWPPPSCAAALSIPCRRANRYARDPLTHRRRADLTKTAQKRRPLPPRIVLKTFKEPKAENQAQSTRKSPVNPSMLSEATMTITATAQRAGP
jgi:hypothetical protein